MCGKLIRDALVVFGGLMLANGALAEDVQVRTVNLGQGTYTVTIQTQAPVRPYALTGRSERQVEVRVVEVGQGRIVVQMER